VPRNDSITRAGRADPDTRAKGNDREDNENGRDDRGAADDTPLNRFDWGGARASANSSTKGDRIPSKAVPTVAVEPFALEVAPQVSTAAPAKSGVSALDHAQREALFQEFLRWQERQRVRLW
jgi:hypothetical protein